MSFGVAGAGFAGAVVARRLAEHGHSVVVHEIRDHVGGNCHTERDDDTGVLVHRYGPHIFHTSDERVWEYLRRFGEMVPYRHQVRAVARGRVYPLPINLLTLNQLLGASMSPAEAAAFLADQGDRSIREPANFEEQALASVGRLLYETFYEGYTRKQWGVHPRELPADVFRRLAIRTDYSDGYFDDTYQALPRHGYTPIVSAMLDHPRIEVKLSTPLEPADRDGFDHVVWTGPVDAWFGHVHGRLTYRTLDFEHIRGDGDLQGCAVMNYTDADVPWTRVTEHKYLAPWESHHRSIGSREYSRFAEPGDVLYYPIGAPDDQAMLRRYLDDAEADSELTLVGRLGTYRYLDIDDTIAAALEVADRLLADY